MLVLEPRSESSPAVWCVIQVDEPKQRATLLMTSDDLPVQASLERASLPAGWRVVNNRRLAERLSARAVAVPHEHTFRFAVRGPGFCREWCDCGVSRETFEEATESSDEPERPVTTAERCLAWALYWIARHGVVPTGDPNEADEWARWAEARQVVKATGADG